MISFSEFIVLGLHLKFSEQNEG